MGIVHLAHHTSGAVGRADQYWIESQTLRRDSLQTPEQRVADVSEPVHTTSSQPRGLSLLSCSSRPAHTPGTIPIFDRVIRYVRTLKGGEVLDDDFSIMDLKV